MLKMFKEYPYETSILDDFNFYETKQDTNVKPPQTNNNFIPNNNPKNNQMNPMNNQMNLNPVQMNKIKLMNMNINQSEIPQDMDNFYPDGGLKDISEKGYLPQNEFDIPTPINFNNPNVNSKLIDNKQLLNDKSGRNTGFSKKIIKRVNSTENIIKNGQKEDDDN